MTIKEIEMKSTTQLWCLACVFMLSASLSLANEPLEVKVHNEGIGGNNTAQLLQRINTDVIRHHPDLTIVMVGTNDKLNSKKMISYQAYAQNLTRVVETLKAANSQVLLMSPPPADSTYLFERHERALFLQTPNEIMDSVAFIVQEIAKDQNVYFLNLFQKFVELDLPKHNTDLFIRNTLNSGVRDGVHPTTLGYHFIAENVFQFLKKNQLIYDGMTVVCFGDSITKGSGSKGGGTVKGDNYPSFLYRRLLDYKIDK